MAPGPFCCRVLHTSLSPELGHGTTLATVFQKNSETTMFFVTEFYVLFLKGKASNKKVFIIEAKLSLNPSHSYNLFVSGHLFLWFSISLYPYELLNPETFLNSCLRARVIWHSRAMHPETQRGGSRGLTLQKVQHPAPRAALGGWERLRNTKCT